MRETCPILEISTGVCVREREDVASLCQLLLSAPKLVLRDHTVCLRVQEESNWPLSEPKLLKVRAHTHTLSLSCCFYASLCHRFTQSLSNCIYISISRTHSHALSCVHRKNLMIYLLPHAIRKRYYTLSNTTVLPYALLQTPTPHTDTLRTQNVQNLTLYSVYV